MDNYLKKYLKYKNKYLQLKQTGGAKIEIYDNIFIYFRQIDKDVKTSDVKSKRKYYIEFISFTGASQNIVEMIKLLQTSIYDDTGTSTEYKPIFIKILQYLTLEGYSSADSYITLNINGTDPHTDYRRSNDTQLFPPQNSDSNECTNYLREYIKFFDNTFKHYHCNNDNSEDKHVSYTNSLNYIYNYMEIINALNKIIKLNTDFPLDNNPIIYTAITGKEYFRYLTDGLFYISLKTDIYNIVYKHAKTDILKLIYKDCTKIESLNICLPQERKNTNLGVYDKLILYKPNTAHIEEYNKLSNAKDKLIYLIFNFLKDFKKYNTTNDILSDNTVPERCENNKKFLLKKNISSTGQGIHILEQCATDDELDIKATQIAESLLAYETIKQTDMTTTKFFEELYNDYFFVQSFYETPFNFPLTNIDTGLVVKMNIRCKLRFHWSPIVIKNNDKIYCGCIIYTIPNIELHYPNKVISNIQDPIPEQVRKKIEDIITAFILSQKGEKNLKELAILFTKFIDDKYTTVEEEYNHKNYLLSKINGADIMLLGNDNHIDEFAFLENNTGGVILGGNPYVSTYLNNHLNVLCGLRNEILKTDNAIVKKIENGEDWVYKSNDHYIYLIDSLTDL